jgi:hypothetical protein
MNDAGFWKTQRGLEEGAVIAQSLQSERGSIVEEPVSSVTDFFLLDASSQSQCLAATSSAPVAQGTAGIRSIPVRRP